MRVWWQKIGVLVLILALLIVLQVLLVAIFMGSLPTAWRFPLVDKILLMQTLFASNPMTALQYLWKTPVLISEQLDTQNQQVWGYYLMPASLLMYVGVALILRYFMAGRALRAKVLLPMMLLLLPVLYLRIAACCTSHPSWVFDVWLLGNVYQPLNDTVFWQDLYLSLQPWFVAIQFVMVAAGFLFTFEYHRRMKLSSK